jgi:hypothetical protein
LHAFGVFGVNSGGMFRLIAALLLMFMANAAAQEDGVVSRNLENERVVEWAVALGGKFGQLHDPVVATYALGRLAETVCAKDPVAGAELFRNSLERLRSLTPDAFGSARHKLPVPSFATLWKSITAAAAKCSPDLQQLADTDHARAKMLDERQQASQNIGQAMSLLTADPDRAAQLARTAMASSDPITLDIPTLTFFLSNLRDRAGDLADELFPDVLDFIASAPQPSPGRLLELGNYLFTAPRCRELPDVQQPGETYTVGSTSIANFAANRKSASSDDIRQYIEAALKVLTATNDPYYDPVAAYAIGFQMLPKAEDMAPDLVDKLRDALGPIAQLAGGSVAKVQAALAAPQAADPEGGEGPRNRDRLVSRVLAMAVAKKFADARVLLKSVGDIAISSQVGPLIDFAEGTAALEKKDAQWAFSLANGIRPGVKRSLLYVGLAGAARDRGEALGYFGLAIRDAELLPAEQRMLITAALTSVMLRANADDGIRALDLFVRAANDAYSSPRKGRFDPQVFRKHSPLSEATTVTDSSLIMANTRCVCEAVDTGRGRHNFTLKVPAVQSTSLEAVVRNATGADTERLEATLLSLRDETLMASGLNALAALRLR